jgi:hypothetical protein
VRRTTATAFAALALLSACGSEDPDTPGACLADSARYLKALERAPKPVTLADDVPISACLIENQPSGELAQVGAAMVEAATRLSAEAGRGDQSAALQLGYLIGAAERGAAESAGIHTDLVRRLESAAQTGPADGLAGAADAVYRRGREGGRETG